MADRPGTLPSPPSSDTEQIILGYILAAIGAVLFSAKAIIVKLAYSVGGPGSAPPVDAITMLSLRMAFALPIYIGIGVWSWRQRARARRPLPTGTRAFILIGLNGMLGYYIASFLDFWALTYITAQFERLILFTYPFFVMVLGALFFGGQITRRGIAALCLAYAGITLIYFKGEIAEGDHIAFGAMLVAIAAFSFSLYQLFAKGWLNQIGARIFTCLAMSGAAVGVLTHFAIRTLQDGSFAALHVPHEVFWLAGALALFSTVLPSFMLNGAIERVGPQAVSMIGTISPIATIAMAIVLLGEPFAFTDAIGTALVLSGVGIFTVRRSRR